METQKRPDPTALGLFGLALVTLVASSQKLGITEGTLMVLPWVVFLGGLAQIVAGIMDYNKGNIFGGTAFFAYGLFWLADGLAWFEQYRLSVAGTPELADVRQFGFAFLGYLIFTIYMTIAATETNKVLLIIFCLIDVLFLGLTLSTFGIMHEEMHIMAGVAELCIAMVSFYGSAASMFKLQFGYELLPVGKPLGIFKK